MAHVKPLASDLLLGKLECIGHERIGCSLLSGIGTSGVWGTLWGSGGQESSGKRRSKARVKAETSWDRARRWYKEGLWPVDV